MLFSQKMQSLAAIVFLSCIAITLATERKSVCCKEVSISRITEPITGFMVHPEKPPCVKAVIFYTSKGAICSHWKENWVREKVTELRRLQAIGKYRKSNTTTVAPQTPEATSENY